MKDKAVGAANAEKEKSSADRGVSLQILSILAVAFVLRVTAIQFGLPYLYHADEPIVVNHALAYASGDFNPHFFKIPPLVSYLLFGVYGFFYALGKISGKFQSPSEFEHFFYSDLTPFYLFGRLIFGVLIGTLTVYAFYRFVKKFFDRKTGLLSAALFAVCFLHARDSHYIYADIPLLLVLVLSFFAILKISEQNDLKLHAAAGAMIGLAAAIKYNGFALIVPYAIATFFSPKKEKTIPGLLIAGISAVGLYSILNPFSLIDWQFFLQELKTQGQSQSGIGWAHHLRYSLWGGLGPFLTIAGVGGALLSLLQPQHHKRFTLAAFVFSYYAVLAFAGQPYDRYALPLVPFLIFFAVDRVQRLCKKLKWPQVVNVLLIIGLTAPTFVKTVMFDRMMLNQDTRTVAKEWIEQNIPAGSHLALGWDFYMPRLSFSKHQLEEKKHELTAQGVFSKAQLRKLEFLLNDVSGKPSYNLYFLSKDLNASGRFLFAKPLIAYDFQEARDYGIDYVLVVRSHEQEDSEVFYQQLNQNAQLIKEFNPYRQAHFKWAYDERPLTGGPFLFRDLWWRERNGPVIQIFKLK